MKQRLKANANYYAYIYDVYAKCMRRIPFTLSEVQAYHRIGKNINTTIQKYIHKDKDVHRSTWTWIAPELNDSIISDIITEYQNDTKKRNQKTTFKINIEEEVAMQDDLKMFIAFKEFMENQSKPK
jgi:hypothetical protein